MTDKPSEATNSLTGRQGDSDVSRQQLQEWLRWFSRLGLRLGGSAAERDAAHYVASELERHGVQTELQTFDSFVSYGREPSEFGPATVDYLDLPGRETLRGKIYAFGASTGPSGIEAEVAWVGTGAPDDYRRLGVDVNGKIALSELSFEAPHGEPARIAAEHGAVGAIVANWSDEFPHYVHTGTARGVWGNPGVADLARLPTIPVVAVSRSAGLALAEDAARGEGRVRLIAESSRRWVPATQPVATIRGASDRYVLVYCHLDTFGAGMTDNTSGVVGLMELARLLTKYSQGLELTVKVAWWACHEMPYNGSTWYLDSHWDDVRDNCIAVINADSWAIGESEGQVQGWAFAELESSVRSWIRDIVGDDLPVTDFDAKEAEQSFWAIGVPSAMVFSINSAYSEREGMEYLGPWFHTEYDTIDRVGLEALAELVRIYLVGVRRLASDQEVVLEYSATAEKIAKLLAAAGVTAPRRLELSLLAEQAGKLARKCATLEDSASDAAADVSLRLGRILNPVLYTIIGRYGQDPSSATYLRKRLPGLQRALDEYAAVTEEERKRAHMTDLLRERNRVADAIAEATLLVEAVIHR